MHTQIDSTDPSAALPDDETRAETDAGQEDQLIRRRGFRLCGRQRNRDTAIDPRSSDMTQPTSED